MITVPNPGDLNLHLNLGCGSNIKKSNDRHKWINVDIRDGNGVDYVVDAGQPLPFESGKFRVVYVCHLLEHFSTASAKGLISEWVRVLHKGGELYIAVPDVLKIAKAFDKGDLGRDSVMKYLYGGQGHEFNFHKSGYCESILRQLMKENELDKIKTWEGDKDDASISTYSLNMKGTKK